MVIYSKTLATIVLTVHALQAQATGVSNTSSPFQLSIVSDKPLYEMGEVIKIKVILKNIEDYTTTFSLGTPELFYGMDVSMPKPSWIPVRSKALRQPRGRESGLSSFGGGPFFPGDEKVSTIALNKLYYMNSPGVYRIRFSCMQTDRKTEGIRFAPVGEPLPPPQPSEPESSSRRIFVESNEIMVEVVSAKAK